MITAPHPLSKTARRKEQGDEKADKHVLKVTQSVQIGGDRVEECAPIWVRFSDR